MKINYPAPEIKTLKARLKLSREGICSNEVNLREACEGRASARCEAPRTLFLTP
ncbi:MAG: hypothetical protein NZ455_03255 [Bacteroidia bacterium]|nr:hypothetical protein [Bacteroidia bacterium]